jgi:Holliday junction DNA helicase RuvA
MIAFVRGQVAEVAAEQAVLDVGGVGLALICPARTLAALRVGEVRQLATSLVVREDSLTLFGFGDADERSVFLKLQSVSGVGPRLAQAVLGVLTPDEIRAAVAADDQATLCRAPGVGRRVAARLVLELKDKLGSPTGVPASAPSQVGQTWGPQVVAGLIALGWPARDAAAAAEVVAAEMAQPAPGAPQPTVSELLRAALRHLDRA